MSIRDAAVVHEVIDVDEDVDEGKDEDDGEPTQVTKLLADYDQTLAKSTECLDLSDVRAEMLRRKLRQRDTPSKMLRAIRESIVPAPERDG